MIPASYALIDPAALQHNLSFVRRRVPGAKVMAVIKANAYGHGLVRVAHALKGVNAFAVARVDEGIRLRQAGIMERIAVLEGFTTAEELELHHAYRLESVIHSPEQFEFLESGFKWGRLPLWLKMDTGMNRLGFGAWDLAAAYERLKGCKGVSGPIQLMTHLSNADILDDDTTKEQIALFRQVTENLEGDRSIANSAGILGWDAAKADWVRPGIMLYGVSPFADRVAADFGLRSVMSLHSRLIAVKQLAPGDAVGYGRSWVCSRPTRLGIAAIGYGDGYPRYAPTGTPVLVNGRRVPLVGRVTMDMITVDLTDYPQAVPGDQVLLWGDGLPVEEVAAHADTIPYTLLCGITQRVRILERERSATAPPMEQRLARGAQQG
ncbi:MAG: alanine racemase [Pseudomonadota bacterium]